MSTNHKNNFPDDINQIPAQGGGRADVLALVPIGKAVRGAEWKAA